MEERIKSMPEIPNFRQMFLSLAIVVFTFFSDFEIRNICVTINVFISVVHGFQDFSMEYC